jgi:hypothetical protein
MKVGRFVTHFGYSLLGALFVVTAVPSRALAQDHDHGAAVQNLSADQKAKQSELVAVVREATERFKDPAVADAEHYGLVFGCVSGGDFGAMGLHLLNGAILAEANKTGVIDPRKPQILLYEPLPNGRVRLTGADFLVDAASWDALHPQDPPQLGGQLFHFFDSPNRFALKPFYTLHVWAWKDSPTGTFANWNANVSCDAFSRSQE